MRLALAVVLCLGPTAHAHELWKGPPTKQQVVLQGGANGIPKRVEQEWVRGDGAKVLQHYTHGVQTRVLKNGQRRVHVNTRPVFFSRMVTHRDGTMEGDFGDLRGPNAGSGAVYRTWGDGYLGRWQLTEAWGKGSVLKARRLSYTDEALGTSIRASYTTANGFYDIVVHRGAATPGETDAIFEQAKIMLVKRILIAEKE
jgi:hypothetical protein